jgi:carotenoid cleavage dioxygenase-like enzyme
MALAMLVKKNSPYLEGNFAPVEHEIEATHLPVIGELPLELNGMLVRNGPNPHFSPRGRYQWFDGDGMLHGVKISQGKASYCNRYVRTNALQIEQMAGHALWKSVMEPPQMANPKNNLFSPFKNVANTSVVWHANHLLALWEGAEPYKINLNDLSTVGSYSYGHQLKTSMTAHPKIDPKTGEMMFFGYSPLVPPYLYYGVISAGGNIEKILPIDLPTGVMMHDFAITENYTLFLDLPLTFSLSRLNRGEPGYLFEPDVPCRIGILPRYGTTQSLRWFRISPCFVIHVLNAYERGEEIVLSALRANDAKGLDMPSKVADVEDRPVLYQWQCNLSTGVVKGMPLDDVAAEFPSLNPTKVGKENRYGYTARMASGKTPMFVFDGLIKYDFVKGTSQEQAWGKHCYGGEAIFVPRPNADVEDNGWLLNFVYDETSQSSELVVMDAQNFERPPIARILLPQRVPYGFHGVWIPEEQA